MRILSFIVIIFVGNLARAGDATEAISKARLAMKQGDNEAALKAAEEAVKVDPKNALARFIRGEARSRFRQHREAIEDYEKAFELDKKMIAAINQRGGERFKMGLVKESIEDFDKYLEAEPKGFEDHWRRGISLYYAERFADGAKQFKAGDKVYGNDVENAFWHYLCTARVDGVEKARKSLLAIGKDGRVPMMKVYDMIQAKVKPDEVIETAEKAKLEGEDKTEALFYAHLYVGLNYEAEGNKEKSLEHIKIAVEKYKIGHYMWDVANVHLKLRKHK